MRRARPSAEDPLLEDAEREEQQVQPDDDEVPVIPFRRLVSLMASPFNDDRGRPEAVAMGLLGLLVSGLFLGLIMPKNHSLPTAWYPTLSSCIGYTYFLCWSVSFYPQFLRNCRRQSTQGLSPDFCLLNVIGFACYATYTLALFASHEIHAEYRERYGPHAEITVQSNDVAFGCHALVLASLTLAQIGFYDGWRSQQPSKLVGVIIVLLLLVIIVMPLLVVLFQWMWLDYLYVLSLLKIVVTLIKYMPQVALNYKRQSTQGWSIWQILLDLSGGVLSNMQLVLDCWMLQDWSGITGNVAKLLLGSTSIVFDVVFMLQHYVWYPHAPAEYVEIDTLIQAPAPVAPEADEEGPVEPVNEDT